MRAGCGDGKNWSREQKDTVPVRYRYEGVTRASRLDYVPMRVLLHLPVLHNLASRAGSSTQAAGSRFARDPVVVNLNAAVESNVQLISQRQH